MQSDTLALNRSRCSFARVAEALDKLRGASSREKQERRGAAHFPAKAGDQAMEPPGLELAALAFGRAGPRGQLRSRPARKRRMRLSCTGWRSIPRTLISRRRYALIA